MNDQIRHQMIIAGVLRPATLDATPVRSTPARPVLCMLDRDFFHDVAREIGKSQAQNVVQTTNDPRVRAAVARRYSIPC